MSLQCAVLVSSRPLSVAYRTTASSSGKSTATRYIASSSRISAQVQSDSPNHEHGHQSAQEGSTEENSQKLGKRARRVLRAKKRREDDRIAKGAKAQAKAEAQASDIAPPKPAHTYSSTTDPSPILKVKHVLDAAQRSPSRQQSELNNWRTSQAQSGDTSKPTAVWSGSLFRSYISSLLSGFGTALDTLPLHDPDAITSNAEQSASTRSSTDDLPRKKGITSPTMTKSERMESQARVIFQAIRKARERGIVDEDESFFYPYPEGVPPKDVDGKDAVWLNLGTDPEAWGKELPPVKDRWLEVLSLGLTKEITGWPHNSAANEEGEEHESEIGFDDLVEDYDLEDHERLEQLGDSIVNMSSRLLAYLSYPDVNEGSLTRLSNYPTQNNLLALLFQECGLAARRDELRNELRRAQGEEEPGTETIAKKAEDGEEGKARLPQLIKRDADMFEAYAAAVFLSNGNDFNIVHEWLCGLFRPFQDQAYRFMVQRSEALARTQARRAAAAANAAAAEAAAASSSPSAATNLAADGLGIKSASVDPSSVPFSSLFPDFSRGSGKSAATAIPTYALNGIGTEAFITDEYLTVAARARRQREERMREELRRQNREELMNMGWFRRGFLNLRRGFRQYVMGEDVVKEEELQIREKVREQRGLSEKERERNRARERNQAGVSIRSTGSRTKMKLNGEAGER